MPFGGQDPDAKKKKRQRRGKVVNLRGCVNVRSVVGESLFFRWLADCRLIYQVVSRPIDFVVRWAAEE